MSQKRAKIHHYLPKAIQKYFASEAQQIWYSERKDDGTFSTPELRTIRSTFKERDYYSVYESGQLSDRIEREFYGAIDDFLGKFLENVHALLDQGKTPTLSDEALDSIQKVAYHLLVRTPDFAKKYDDYETGREILERTIVDAIAAGVQADEIAKVSTELKDAAHVRNLGRTVRVKAQAKPTELILESLKNLDVRFAICEGKHSFILPSSGGYRVGNGGPNGLVNPNMEIWLPISPKRALVLLQDPKGRIPILVRENRDHIRKVNLFGVENSGQVASHSEKLLKSLLGM